MYTGIKLFISVGLIVILGLIAYAGFRYMISNGDLKKAEDAKNLTVISGFLLLFLLLFLVMARVISYSSTPIPEAKIAVKETNVL